VDDSSTVSVQDHTACRLADSPAQIAVDGILVTGKKSLVGGISSTDTRVKQPRKGGRGRRVLAGPNLRTKSPEINPVNPGNEPYSAKIADSIIELYNVSAAQWDEVESRRSRQRDRTAGGREGDYTLLEKKLLDLGHSQKCACRECKKIGEGLSLARI
jgi:hypothetical protein